MTHHTDQQQAGPTICPCTWTAPCHEDCTCVERGSSRGCNRCNTYGSREQRQARAEMLAAMIDQAIEARHITGRTPRQLADEREQLREALRKIENIEQCCPTADPLALAKEIARAALARHQEPHHAQP